MYLVMLMGCDPAAASVALVLVHGRGQTPEDMAGQIVRHLTVPGLHVRLPCAAGKSWYSAKAVDPMTPLTEQQLAASLDQVQAELAAMPDVPVVLAGFSQGACLSLEFMLRRMGRVAGLCLFTGCRIGSDAGLPVQALPGLPVYGGCGDDDPWIPLPRFSQAMLVLAQAGARVRADVFPGRGHEVASAEIAALSDMLQALAA